MTIGTGKLAAEIGITRQRINELGRKGKIKREPDGNWDLAKVKAALGNNLDTHQAAPSLGEKPKAKNTGGRGSREITIPLDPDAAPAGEGGTISLAEAQLRHELAKATKTEFEVAKLKGTLIDAYEAAVEWGTMITSARNRALLIPSKIAPKVAATSDVVSCQEILDREIRSFLTELSEYRPNA
jgi:hypothetical protein